MNPKHTWAWIAVGAGLFAFIFFFERHRQRPAPGLAPLLSNFKAADVTSVRVRPANTPDMIRVDRTNSGWTITQPVAFPANQTRVEALLAVLERLAPATVITARELQNHPKADEEFGFHNPQYLLELQQADLHTLKFGARTAPGDQVFVQVVGGVDVFVVDAELMKLLPGSINDWRDPTLLDLGSLVFDRISITNAGKVIALQHDATNNLWRSSEPLPARADRRHLDLLLQKLHGLSISQFVSDDPAADLDTFGLSPPGLSLAFARGTNQTALLQFGKTNAAGHFFARRVGINSVVTVPPEPLVPWREPVNEFRDRQLLAVPEGLREIEVRAAENFILQRTPSNTWQIATEKFPADPALVNDFLTTLGRLEIAQFVQDAVLSPDLGRYGLTSPTQQVIFRIPAAPGTTNAPLAHVSFGYTVGENIYARRADEDSVYAVRMADVQTLPVAGWQLRQRRIWNFQEHELARVVIHQAGKTRELIHDGTNSWSFAAGSQGILNGLAIEQTTLGFCNHAAPPWVTAWVARGEAARAGRYGITTNTLALTFELKRGEKFDIHFGANSPAQYPYARVTLEGEPWIFEFSTALYHLVDNYLTIPANVP
jgi:hypothetical protein